MLIPMNQDSQRTLVVSEGRNGMRRNANGARDLFAPVQVGKEVLAESLASHGWNSVAGQKRGGPSLGISKGSEAEPSSRMGIVGTHPGSFRKSGKQWAYGIPNLEVHTEDGRRIGNTREREGGPRRGTGLWLEGCPPVFCKCCI